MLLLCTVDEESFGQVVNDFSKEESFQILSQKVEHQTVTDGETVYDDTSRFTVGHRRFQQNKTTNLGRKDGRPQDNNRQTGDGRQKKEPKPEEDVQLFVQSVERKDALSIVCLKATRRSVFVECAFRHPGKHHFNHWIKSILLIHVGELQYADAEIHRDSVEETVDEVNVSERVGKVEQLGKHVNGCVTTVRVPCPVQVGGSRTVSKSIEADRRERHKGRGQTVRIGCMT